MRYQHWIWFAAFIGLVVVACGGGSSDGTNRNTGGTLGTGGTGGVVLTCDMLDPVPEDCLKACTSNRDCTASFCDSGQCQANCAVDQDCGSSSVCTSRGTCLFVGGTGGNLGTGGIGECQSVTITPTRSIPNVMFLVDQSGSMDASFGSMGENRWEAANTVINGIVDSTDSIVRYGLTTYTSNNGFDNPPCPKLPTQIDFQLNNSTNIGNDSLYPYSYPSAAGADTPTGDSIDATVSAIQSSPPPNEGPTIIVLATDGAPDSCENPDPNTSETRTQARDEAVVAAGASHDAGIDLFVLWVGTLTDNGVRAHVQEVANEGIGLPRDGSSGDAEFWVGTDPASLENEFREIISASISCDVQMNERFDDKEKACNDPESDVRLNGERIPCSDTDGWRVKPGVDDMIELVGGACDTFKSGDVTFSAEFPCGAIVVE